MAKKKTHEEFLIELLEKNEHYRNGSIIIKEVITNMATRIKVQSKFGEHLVAPTQLLKRWVPTILSAVDKTQYFLNKLREVNPYFAKGEFIVEGEYTKVSDTVDLITSLGRCRVTFTYLLSGQYPTIKSAVNPPLFLWNTIKDKLQQETYTYEGLPYKVGRHWSLDIICPKHGLFTQRVDHHINGSGCPQCNGIMFYKMKNLQGLEEKLDHLYHYIIKLTGEDEVFYKTGLTKRPKGRFKEIEKVYNVEIELCYETPVFEGIKTEQYFINKYAHLSYKPKKDFNGQTECFSENPLYYEYYPLNYLEDEQRI